MTPVQLVIVNVYARNGKVDVRQWQSLFDMDERHIIYCEDFNARSSQWGNCITNRQGEDLEDALASAALICLNDGKVTRIATRPGDSDSVIDWLWCRPPSHQGAGGAHWDTTIVTTTLVAS